MTRNGEGEDSPETSASEVSARDSYGRETSPFQPAARRPVLHRVVPVSEQLPGEAYADMTGILDKFHVEHGIHGARVMARSNQLTGDCISDGEIDSAIQMLKDDLDACAREMKRLLEVNRRGSMFEGWPSANDDTVEA